MGVSIEQLLNSLFVRSVRYKANTSGKKAKASPNGQPRFCFRVISGNRTPHQTLDPKLSRATKLLFLLVHKNDALHRQQLFCDIVGKPSRNDDIDAEMSRITAFGR